MTNRYLLIRRCTHLLWLLGLTLLLGGSALAQGSRYTLKGRVTDAAGSGIPGVTVVLRGTSQGTTSASDGSYALGTSGHLGAPRRWPPAPTR